MGVMGCDCPALLSPFTLTLALSHRGRGDSRINPPRRGGKGGEGEGICAPALPPQAYPARVTSFARAPFVLRKGRRFLAVLGMTWGCRECPALLSVVWAVLARAHFVKRGGLA